MQIQCYYRIIRKIPGFGTGDEAIYVWFSSACTNMGQQADADMLFRHNKRPPMVLLGTIIAQKQPFVDTRFSESGKLELIQPLSTADVIPAKAKP